VKNSVLKSVVSVTLDSVSKPVSTAFDSWWFQRIPTTADPPCPSFSCGKRTKFIRPYLKGLTLLPAPTWDSRRSSKDEEDKIYYKGAMLRVLKKIPPQWGGFVSYLTIQLQIAILQLPMLVVVFFLA
jgi:hypothetical protein